MLLVRVQSGNTVDQSEVGSEGLTEEVGGLGVVTDPHASVFILVHLEGSVLVLPESATRENIEKSLIGSVSLRDSDLSGDLLNIDN